MRSSLDDAGQAGFGPEGLRVVGPGATPERPRDPESVARLRAEIQLRLATVAKARGLAVITTEDTDLRIATTAVNVTEDVAKAN